MTANWRCLAFIVCVVVELQGCKLKSAKIQATKAAGREDEALKACEDRIKTLKEEDWQWEIAGAQELLARFGYGTIFTGELDSRTKTALSEYQQRQSLPVTSNLDCPTILKINSQDRLAHPLTLDDLLLEGNGKAHVDEWQNGIAFVKGTWTITNDKMANPLQVSDVTCLRDQMKCREVTATIFNGNVFGKQSPLLTLLEEEYSIERWDKYEIVTRPKDTNCTRYVLRFNRVQRQVTGTRSTIHSEGACEGVERKEYSLVLADGNDVVTAEEETRAKARRDLLVTRGALARRLLEKRKQPE